VIDCVFLCNNNRRGGENGKETNVGVNVCASDVNDDDKSSNDNSDNFCEGMGLPRWHTV
jgi:hypothetical protein